MNKIQVKKGWGGVLATALLTALATFTSCSDWDDHYEGGGVESSNATLWEQIAAREELSDFSEVLNSTMVFRQHKKTAVSYAETLQGGRSLTVFAPVNGTFNKDSLIALTQTAQGDSAVERFFVMNHLASTLRSASDTTVSFRTLNWKRVDMQSDKVGGVAIMDRNLHCKNGVMHILQQVMPYKYTIYEALTHMDEFQPAGQVLSSYNEDVFNENASVSSGVVDGVPVYVDSVIYERNKLMERIGQLNAEDSSYLALVPTVDGWNRAWQQAASYYKFSSSLEKSDSLQRYWTSRAMFDDAIFSMKWQKSPKDSLVSVQYSSSNPEYHVFYNPYEADGIVGKSYKKYECSNGTLCFYDEWPFTPEQTYFQKIEQEAEQTWNISNYDLCTVNGRAHTADSISEGAYLDIVPRRGTDNWKVTHKLHNTLAGAYDFCIIVLPKTVENPRGDKRPNKFNVTINYIDEDGTPRTYNCDGKTFTNDPLVTDTIVVAENFKLPACNYDQNNDKVSITITCNISAREQARYNREMYLDCIFLRPRAEAEPNN